MINENENQIANDISYEKRLYELGFLPGPKQC